MLDSFLRTLSYNVPAMMAIVAGMVWTYSNWHQHPPAARWAMFAFVWMFITYLLAIFWYSIGIVIFLQNNFGFDDQQPILMTLSSFEAFGYLLFMIALNAARYPYRPRSFYDDIVEDEASKPPAEGPDKMPKSD